MTWHAWGRVLFRLIAGSLFTIGFPLALSGCATVEPWETAKEPELLGFEVIVPASDVQPRYVDWRAIRGF